MALGKVRSRHKDKIEGVVVVECTLEKCMKKAQPSMKARSLTMDDKCQQRSAAAAAGKSCTFLSLTLLAGTNIIIHFKEITF